MKNSEEILKNYLSIGLKPNLDINWDKGWKEYIKINGERRKIIDFTSGILVNCLGYKNKSLTKGLNKVINSGLVHSYHYGTEIKNIYLNSLYDFSNELFDEPKFYLTSSGTEATETCMKLMLRHGKKLSLDKNKILTIEGNYHGRTMGSSLMSSGSLYSEIWPVINDFFPKIKFPYTWEVNEQNGIEFFNKEIDKLDPEIQKNICGVLIETYQGWGACSYPKSFIKAIEKFCIKNQIVFGFDEMQSGFYRTGLKFGYQHYDVSPDMICIGKGMGGGLPLSGLIGKSKIMDLAIPGELSSTHSCNPLSCAAGNVVLDVMKNPKFINQLNINAELFSYLGKELCSKYSFLSKKSNFLGMVGALVFDFDDIEKSISLANNFCEAVLEKGILVIKTGRESVKLSPPLIIRQKSIFRAFEIFDMILKSI